jgi:hypothetical protein
VVDIERRVAALELADTLDLEALAALQREVLEDSGPSNDSPQATSAIRRYCPTY